MVRLTCAVVGDGSVFSVEMELTNFVDELKWKIKMEKPGLVYFDYDLLDLYLVREGDRWLNARDPAIKALKARTVPDRIKNLMQDHLRLQVTATLDDDTYFGKDFQPGDNEIHVLVEWEEPDEFYPYRRPFGILPHERRVPSDGSSMEDGFSWRAAWSFLRPLFPVEKEKQD